MDGPTPLCLCVLCFAAPPATSLFRFPLMANVEDPAIAKAYQDIRNDKTGLNWVVLGYADNTKLVVQATGSGGVAEAVTHLKENECQYGFLKLVIKADDETTRTKFVLFSWAGAKASALKKGKMSVHKAAVKSIFTDFAVEVHGTSQEELSEENLVKLVKKANY